MVHFASIRHPAAILDDLHGKVLNEAYQISKSTVTESVSTEMQREEHYVSLWYKFLLLMYICNDNQYLSSKSSDCQLYINSIK